MQQVIPLQAQSRASPHRIRLPGQELKQELSERLAPMTDSAHLTALLDRVSSWWEGDELVLPFIDPFPKRLMGV